MIAPARIVEPRQVWSVLVEGRGRARTRVHLAIVLVDSGIAYGVDAGGHEHTVSVRVLQQGKRGAQLCGAPPSKDRHQCTRLDDKKNSKRAKRETQPHALQEAVPMYAEALAMWRAGKPYVEIAAHFGSTVDRVKKWTAKARDAEADARFRRTG